MTRSIRNNSYKVLNKYKMLDNAIWSLCLQLACEDDLLLLDKIDSIRTKLGKLVIGSEWRQVLENIGEVK